MRLGACFGLIALSIIFVDTLIRSEKGVNLIWFANAMLLSYLLLAPRWRWSAYVVTAFLALVVGSALVHEAWRLNLLYNILDIAEALGAALLLRRRSMRLPHFTRPRYLLQFIAAAVLLMPLLSGAVCALIGALWLRLPPAHVFLYWFVSDSLGMAVITPTFVAILRARLRGKMHWRRDSAYLLLLGAVTAGAFLKDGVLLIFLVYPLLVVAVLRMDRGWGAVCAALVAVEACAFTVSGMGPFALSPNPSIMLQVFIAAAVMMVYATSAITDDLRATHRRLKEIAALHELVTENSRDVIILADFNGKRNYVSAAAAEWGGWDREDLLGHHGMDIIHPADKAKAEALIQEVRAGGSGGLLECRVQKKDGEYIWVEANIRPVRDPVTGVVTGVLNMVRDVAKRKAAEQELRNAYRALEALAVTDGLTHLANRRHFDQCLMNEWRRCLREQLPLSLLLIDVDLFKLYNDTYGHLRGDSCLKEVASATQEAVTRPNDLVARFGGEEFAVLLPNTSNEGALQVAEHVCASIRGRSIVHSGNPPGYVTVSVGCATMVPAPARHSAALIQKADDALYAAKRAGRNRVANARPVPDDARLFQAS
ncbi:MAG TPA: diguanylate cyclase [Terracidiphilus sp.]|nr:diguanylate cyclase [Terracidiphilus sp.]